ncbi:SDH family Clp fold serine proteinase [Neobacillus endophyticus]|uniref:SDH family Clp fold serine proteinase n=1 Tax=Neobacillus endophyticus TaxID=2738405 RepID=UPI001C27098E|nr:hypothetical protein [Neobacillus endophyticus]
MLNDRIELIKEIEERRRSKVIVYITGDRPNLGARIAPDVLRPLAKHLSLIGNQKRIDLFLYTRGGDVITPVRINYLLREFAKEFNVIVPYKAYSAGTLLCLGADNILMGVLGELGPIDPSVANQFNPSDPNNPNAKIPISVEDVFAYLSLARERADQVGNKGMSDVFNTLTNNIHPLALGNIHRNYTLIRNLAEKVLRLKNSPPSDQQIKDIVDILTEKLYTHSYIISRKEASDIGLPIQCPEDELTSIFWSLYKSYEKELKLKEPFIPDEFLIHRENEIDFEAVSGCLESTEAIDVFKFYGSIQRIIKNNQQMVNINIRKEQWEKIKTPSHNRLKLTNSVLGKEDLIDNQ